MTRLEFSSTVLQKGMGFVESELNCLAKPPGPVETFEVCFKNPQLLEKFWKIFNSSRSSPPYNKFKAYPLSDTESKVVTVNFHNECIQEYDIETWLNRYATIKSEGRRVLDEDQVWTGGLKWLVQLKPDPTGVGGVRHLPSTITLGNNRGSVHYYGMPKLCRNCGNLGHLAAACTACKICQGDHPTADCTTTRPCNLCGVVGHFFRTCPRSYVGRARADGPTNDNPQPPPQPPTPLPPPTSPPPPTNSDDIDPDSTDMEDITTQPTQTQTPPPSPPGTTPLVKGEPEPIPTSQSLFSEEEDDPTWSQVTHQKRKRPPKRPNQKTTPEPKPQRQKARPNPTPPPSPTPIPSGPLPVPTMAQPSDPIANTATTSDLETLNVFDQYDPVQVTSQPQSRPEGPHETPSSLKSIPTAPLEGQTTTKPGSRGGKQHP
ncbi:hypothetical protein DPEC_G00179110 [Dallia pectoralis]|uniref:Uncharacterized protein n=1 Tax=Dallia pectoralis TaxID=75939 RepID=A0ACC2GFE0_DALPE|nr:hypothetical protein DPEC_G00179110 [Dallia pectoralis]